MQRKGVVQQPRAPGWVVLDRLTALREDWPDALRMLLATVAAASISSALRLPETYWAALSAIVVARPNAIGSGRAGTSRLVGTVLGSAVGMGVVIARPWHLPDILLLAVAMVPLSVLVTAFEEYRTAPVAAIIILSSGSALLSPLHLALLRLAEVTIGSTTSMLIGATVLPSRGHGRFFRMAAAALVRIGATLEKAFDESRDEARLDAAHDEIRRNLRELTLLVRSKGGPGAQGRIVRLLSRLQADSMFVSRVVRAGLQREGGREYARAVQGACKAVADCLADADSAEQLERAATDLLAASSLLPDTHAGSGHALDFLLQALARDLHDLIKVLRASR